MWSGEQQVRMIKSRIAGIQTFFNEVMMEVRKASWPTRKELISSTIMVIVSVLLLSVYIGVCDKILSSILKVLIPPSG
jgi:preprotein translocase subunit SecE